MTLGLRSLGGNQTLTLIDSRPPHVPHDSGLFA